MTRERQAAAILALGVVAAALGFGGAAWLDGRGEPPPPPAAAASAVPAAPPEEALLQPPPPAVEPAGRPRRAPAPVPEPEPARSRAGAGAPDGAGASIGPRDAGGARPSTRASASLPSPAARRSAGRSPRGRRDPGRRGADRVRAGPARARDGPRLGRAGVGGGGRHPPRARPLERLPGARRAAGARGPAGHGRPGAAGQRVVVRAPPVAGRAGAAARPGRGHPDLPGAARASRSTPWPPPAAGGGSTTTCPPRPSRRRCCEMGVERAAGARRFLVWEYYDVADDPDAIRPGASAMAQARVALLMAHGAARTGDPRLERAALDALASFVVLVDRGGVRTLVATAAGQEPAPWYVERAYPGESPWKGAALNGFMVTLLNLLGTAAALDRGGAAVPRGRGGHRPGARPRRPRGGDARAPPRRPRLGLLELLRPAHARAPLAQLPRRPQLPLLPRAPARPAGRGLPRPRLRRDGGAVAGLRRPRRRRLPDALSG